MWTLIVIFILFIGCNRWCRCTIRIIYIINFCKPIIGSQILLLMLAKRPSQYRMWHGSYGDMVENQAKQLQMHAMKKTIKQLASVAPKNVVIADGVIKLHETDTREEYLKNWKQKLIEIC